MDVEFHHLFSISGYIHQYFIIKYIIMSYFDSFPNTDLSSNSCYTPQLGHHMLYIK
jgi:hypothetical protein